MSESDDLLLLLWDDFAPEALVHGVTTKFAGDRRSMWLLRKYLRDKDLIDENGIPRKRVF
jgi:hypothetical protein